MQAWEKAELELNALKEERAQEANRRLAETEAENARLRSDLATLTHQQQQQRDLATLAVPNSNLANLQRQSLHCASSPISDVSGGDLSGVEKKAVANLAHLVKTREDLLKTGVYREGDFIVRKIEEDIAKAKERL